MIRRAALLGLLGLAIVTGLFVWRGIGPVLTIFTTAGFGIVIIAVTHGLPMLLNARAWQILVPNRRRPNTLKFLWAVLLREAVNGLLPVARIGGEVVTAKLLNGYGLSMPLAIASLAADVTICLVTQLFFTLIGIALFMMRDNDSGVVRGIIVSTLVAFPMILLFYVVQKKGLFRIIKLVIDKMFGERFHHLTHNADALDRKIRRVYKRQSAIIACAFWQLAGWVVGALEIGVALYFLGIHVTWVEAVIIESLIQAVSSSAFVVPGALGVQEGGFVVVCSWLGIGPEAALALALTRRARDLILFVPALVVWQGALGHKLLVQGRAGHS